MASVWVFAIMRNEAVLLPYWLRHYQSFATRIVVYDDESDDGTRELLTDAGVDLRVCPWKGFDDYAAWDFCNAEYKQARGQADWVMWVDGDEFIYHPKLPDRLDDLRKQGIDVARVQGYQMFSETLPTTAGQIYDEIVMGTPNNSYSKPEVINPTIDGVWGVGRDDLLAQGIYYGHRVEGQPWYTIGPECDQQPPLKLLHYRWLGRDYYLARNRRTAARYVDRSDRGPSNRIQVMPEYTGILSEPWYIEQSRAATRVV